MKKLTAALALVLAFMLTGAVYANEEVRYTFDGTLSDAEASGDISYTEGMIGEAVHFENSAYLTLPAGIVSDAEDFTISAWVKPDETLTWARVFDFGTGTSKYMFLTVTNGSQTTFAITTGGSGSEQKITADPVFSAGEWTHIAVTKSGKSAVMYADGVEVGRNDSMTVSPKDLGSTDKNYIAKSQYDDPYFSGAVDDFRIYDYALGAEEIEALAGEPNNGIVSVARTQISVKANDKAKLPDYVEAELADGSKRNVKVAWGDVDTSRDGVYEISGSIIGTEVKAVAEVEVTSLSTTAGLTATAEIMADSGVYTAAYTVANDSAVKEAVFCVAAYENGTLAGVGINETDDLQDGIYFAAADVPEAEDVTVKAFIWDKSMNPLGATAKKSFGNPYGSSFEVSEVKLADGIFKDSQETGKIIIKALDVDRLLAPVAYSVGAISDTSKYYGGWEAYNYRGYKGKGISGHSLGHWMSAASSMYAATGDEEIKQKLDYAVDKLKEYQDLDGHGFIGGFSREGFEKVLNGDLTVSAFDLNGYWVPWYSLHKIYQGLIDAYKLAGNEKALEVVCAFADWAKTVTDPMSDEKFAQMLECEYGGMNEVMAELYDITGNKEYLDLAVRFSQESILTPLAEDRDELQGKHANTQIPKVIGAAEVYEQDEDRTDYREAARFFFDTVVNHRSYVIGGNSNYEHFGAITEEVLGTQTCETCNTYNMMKLAEHLYAWDHDAAYMDYYERALFNHILASQDPESGMKTYFMATKQGHFKVYSTMENSFWCCVGSGMENPARYTRDIYYKDGDSFYVNQFISSSVEWKEKGLTISQQTNYPYEDTTVIAVDEGSAEAAVNIRIPSWLADDAQITVVCGDAVEEPVTVKATGEAYYYTIERVWSKGDSITVKLPMGLHTYTARDSKNKVAFMYGPVVLAGALGTENFPTTDLVSDHTSLDSAASISVPDIITDNKDPESFITPTDLANLEFEMNTGSATVELMPYFTLHHQRYSLYWNLYGEDEEIDKDEFTIALDAATLDTVRPNEQQPEVDHAMQSNNSYSGYFDTAARGWRDARGADGYFSYEMKVDPQKDNYVMALYWGGDGDFSADGVSYTRDFSILADDTVIGTQTLNNNSAGNLIYVYYKIPADVVEGKEKVTVKFAPNGAGKAAGGVFEVRITDSIVEKK